MKYDIKILKWKTRLERMTMNHLNHHSSEEEIFKLSLVWFRNADEILVRNPFQLKQL